MKPKVHLFLKYSALASSAIAAASAVYAQPDYAPAIWHPCCNANWYTSGYGHKFCVIHDMEGYYGSTVSYFTSCSHTSSSVFYAVNGQAGDSGDGSSPAGEISQMVRESYYAWHALCWNQYSFGTEHEGFQSNPAWYTDAMYAASGGLQAHLCSAWGIAKDRNHIVAHGEKSNANWVAYCNANFGCSATCNTHTDPGPYWDWTKFMSYISGGGSGGKWSGWYIPTLGYAASGPGMVNTRNGTLSMFITGGGNIVYQSKYTAGGWTGWSALPGVAAAGTPAACSRAGAMIDLVVRGTDNNIWMANFNGTSWGGWYVLLGGGTFTTDPAIVDTQNGQLWVFAAQGSTLYQAIWNGSAWVGWYSMPGFTTTSAPSVTCRAAGTIDIVAKGTDNYIWHNWYNGTAWQSSWTVPVAGASALAPAIVSTGGPGQGTLSTFIVGGGGIVYQAKYNGTAWSGYAPVGNGVGNSAPAACSRFPGMIDLTVRSGDNNIWMANYQ